MENSERALDNASAQHLRLKERQRFHEEVYHHDMDNYPPSAHLQIDCKKREWLWVVPKCEPSKQQEMPPALICLSYLQLRWGASLPWRWTWTSWSKWTWWTSLTRRPWTFSWTQAQGQTRGPWRLQYQVSQPVSEFLKTHITLVVSWDATLRIRLSWGAFLKCSQLAILVFQDSHLGRTKQDCTVSAMGKCLLSQ